MPFGIRRNVYRLSIVAALVLTRRLDTSDAFLSPFRFPRTTTPTNKARTLQMSGDGVANGYTWHEEAFELEVTVQVPKKTKAKDVLFKATPTSVDLKLSATSDEGEDQSIILLDGSRPLRGKVSLEGTFWVIGDPEEASGEYRQVTVTIEKQIRSPKDDFDVIDYDWKGVYKQEEDDEVSYRRYDEAEELDVREYAASLGVDIDNINMSMVDKTMFTSGMNLTRSSLDSLKESGLWTETTQQNDGTEWTVDEEGNPVPFDSGIPQTVEEESDESKPAPIPFLDTDSPWNKKK